MVLDDEIHTYTYTYNQLETKNDLIVAACYVCMCVYACALAYV